MTLYKVSEQVSGEWGGGFSWGDLKKSLKKKYIRIEVGWYRSEEDMRECSVVRCGKAQRKLAEFGKQSHLQDGCFIHSYAKTNSLNSAD